MPEDKATRRLRIVFWSSSEFGLPVLSCLVRSDLYDIPLVITRAPAPKGRKHEISPTVVADYVRAEFPQLELAEPAKLVGNDELKVKLRILAPDAYILASFGMILPQSLLDITPHPLCLHPGPLPKLRGPTPIRAALLQGMQATQLCVMKMVKQMDEGPVMLRRDLAIDPQDDFGSLRAKLALLGAQCAYVALRNIAKGNAEYEPQDESQATYTKLLKPRDDCIDLSWDARQIMNFVRSLAPEPGAVCLDPWGHRLKILRATVRKQRIPGATPGAIIAVGKHSFEFAAGDDNSVSVQQVQPEGRRIMTTTEYLSGHHMSVGLSISAITANEQPDNSAEGG
jgi:methionyl-tRNA formyltransferase